MTSELLLKLEEEKKKAEEFKKQIQKQREADTMVNNSLVISIVSHLILIHSQRSKKRRALLQMQLQVKTYSMLMILILTSMLLKWG